MEDLADAAGGAGGRLLGQRQGGGKQKAGNHRTQRSQKGADEVERDDGAHIALGPFLVLCQGVQDQEKDKQGGQGLQRAYEQGAQEAEEGGAGQEEAQDSALPFRSVTVTMVLLKEELI